ncbi:uncharacterized protein RHO25_011991 [Cercospora beticola]|uniref:Siderophore iron transporter mirC n=1 Tax=Cercospora beticola TaxID=122368 RepID=A0ABZ0P6B2_CERBT|nr:hypothetical protein RHO25_011991 [Cercospora beticola]
MVNKASETHRDARYKPLPRDAAADVELDPLNADGAESVDLSLDEDEYAGASSRLVNDKSRYDKLDDDYGGAAMMEGVVAVWRKWDKYFEFDMSITSSYETYALSDFMDLSMQGTLDVIGAIISAGVKIPIAKISDVIGRSETYMLMLLFLVASYVLHASAPGFNTYLIGSIFFTVGQAGIALTNMIVVSDVTSMRSRTLAINLLYSPFVVVTWASGIIVDQVKNGIGWRWGYGMFVFITPIGGSLLVAILLSLQRKARRAGYATSRKMSFSEFCSRIDVGGSLLISTGAALVLLPVTLAAQSADHWNSAWVKILIITGIVLLVLVVPYEALVARHPVLPLRYLRISPITIAFVGYAIDGCGYKITHTYLVPWSIAAHNFSARNAMYLSSIHSVTTLLTGICVGWLVYRTRSYKWVCVIGSVIRLVGYGLMVRIRTNDSTTLELFAVQMLQGLGSGCLETTMFVAAQIPVSHGELAGVTALIAMSGHMGSGIGSATAGGIYTTSMKERLSSRLGANAKPGEIDSLYDSITGTLPAWGSQDRQAVAAAYSDVMGYMTVVALWVAAPVVILALLMPNNKLGDGNNLQEAEGEKVESDKEPLAPDAMRFD